MTIGRMQMNRQLYGLGSYFPPENGREKFGLGSKLKRFARKIIPNEVSKIAVKAAPFVAPFNPLLAGAMAGIGGFDQTGRIGSSLKSGLLTYGGGQLGRYIGGAGFQQGINPFAGYSSAGSFGGLGSLFTSPIGTQTGLRLGQYEMFGGPGADAFKAGQVTDPGVVVSGTRPIQPGTFIGEGVDAGTRVADYTGEIISDVGGATAKTASRGYMDITKDLFSGDFTKMGNAAKELGGKALKDIYTTPITNQAGEVVGSKVDKMAVLATLSAIPSYLDAKKAADDAGIEGFDEAAYNAERDKYMERYKANLPASSFGIQGAANGGRIGYAEGMSSQMAMAADMIKRGMDEDTISSITNLTMDQIQQIKQGMTQQKANGGRIGYREGTPREGIVSLTDEDSGVIYRDPKTGEPLTTTEFLRRTAEDEADIQLLKEGEESGSQFISRPDDEDKELDYGAPSITLPEKKTMRERLMEPAVPKQINREMEDKFENYLKKLVTGKKDGGRIGYGFGGISSAVKRAISDSGLRSNLLPPTAVNTIAAKPVDTTKGTSVNQLFNYYKDKETDEARRQQIIDLFMRDNAAKGGRMGFMMGTEVPMRQNQGGITELDYRKTGGFVPVGVKEKADDVPAMLSKNEFVFTADAVRGAGKGDINKGAKMMYAKMKALEGKVKKLKKTKKKKVKV